MRTTHTTNHGSTAGVTCGKNNPVLIRTDYTSPFYVSGFGKQYAASSEDEAIQLGLELGEKIDQGPSAWSPYTVYRRERVGSTALGEIHVRRRRGRQCGKPSIVKFLPNRKAKSYVS